MEDVSTSASCVLHDVPQGGLKIFWPWQSSHHINVHSDLGSTFQVIFHCIQLPFLSTWFQFAFSCSWTSRRHPSLADAGEYCLHGALLYLSNLDHSTTKNLHVVRTENFENFAPSLDSCFFQDSPEIHINIFWSTSFQNNVSSLAMIGHPSS